jgi:hypothetical protein
MTSKKKREGEREREKERECCARASLLFPKKLALIIGQP